jgi:ubiquinone/menaquinone biosynthesis C-methylase UbiE
MDRTFPGSRPLATVRSDFARLDFAEGARAFITTKIWPAVGQQTQSAMENAFAEPTTAPQTADQIRQVMAGAPLDPIGHRFTRTVQEIIWQTTFDTLRRREPDLRAELDAADQLGPGTVSYDPSFRYPDYFTNNEFHLQQGGYLHPLAGYIYHLGGNVFHSGKNEHAEANQTIVQSLPVPADGIVQRILELGCSVGMSSVPLKERFPQSEVWGTDISAAMVRYAHKRAIELNAEICFKQMLAEEITFPDDHFDIVFANILFHEMPTSATRRAIAEAHRVLRPGGVVAFADIKDRSHIAPGPESALATYNHTWQVENNGEIYHMQFIQSDLAVMLREAGFRNVNANYSANTGAWAPSFSLPLRVGEK